MASDRHDGPPSERVAGPVEVLLVDDDERWARTTARLLERFVEPFTVQTVHGVRAGSDRLAKSEFDCVVCDYHLGDGTAFDLLEFVGDRRPGLPFVLVTGRGSETLVREAFDRGVADYVPKGRGGDETTLLANRIEAAVAASRGRTAPSRTDVDARDDRPDRIDERVHTAVRADLRLALAAGELLDGRVDADASVYRDLLVESTRAAIERTEHPGDGTTAPDRRAPNGATALRETIDRVVASVRSRQPNAPLAIDGPIPAVRVRVDDAFEGVFCNLLRDAVGDGRRNRPDVTISASAGEAWATVTVADVESRLPGDRQPGAYEPGTEGDERATVPRGLYLLDRLVDRRGGTVRANDRPAGTAIHVELPVVAPPSNGRRSAGR